MPVRTVGGGSAAPTGPAGFTDSFSLRVSAADTNAALADTAAYAMTAAYSDSNAAAADAATLKFPSPDFADTSAAPSDTDTTTLRAWLSASTVVSTNGVTNIANMNGANNATVTTYTSQAAGDANPRTTSTLGANVPTVTVTSAVVRVWFKSVNTLATSTTQLVISSTGGLFADKVMFSNTTASSTVDHLVGDFTYDLIANGVNTLAKIQSVVFKASTQDAVAGVTPAVLTIDAATIEIAGAF